MKLNRTQIAIVLSLLFCSVGTALAQVARYSSWGIDEYELFGLTKQQLATKFKSRAEFRENFKRFCIAPQKGACAGYDGPTFELTFENNKVSKIQRIFMGCKETQWGPLLTSKEGALRYFVSSMNDIARSGPLRPDEVVKLKAAQAELDAMPKHRPISSTVLIGR
jgi:hypothetical protein